MPGTFVFNDQNQKNSYGFKILTSGINLDRFKKNPVLLNQHYNHTGEVVGKWINLRVENDNLLGDPTFDEQDDDANKLKGKVDRGFINSCSMGISFNRDDFKLIGDEIVLTKCELYECSLVAVPSNANSVRLYANNGELMIDKDIKNICLSLKNETENFINMNKIILQVAVLVALGFDKSLKEVEQNDLENAVLALHKENTALKAKNLTLETAAENAQQKAVEDMVNLAIKEGRISATKKDDFVKLAKADFELAKNTLASIPVKATLSNQVVPGSTAVTTKAEFQKLSASEQLAFKTNNPDDYNKLFNIKK